VLLEERQIRITIAGHEKFVRGMNIMPSFYSQFCYFRAVEGPTIHRLYSIVVEYTATERSIEVILMGNMWHKVQDMNLNMP
jgi:hypothetical protein